MLIDDGRGLEEPLDWNNIRSIDELRVFERAVVQPDYASIYSSDPMRAVRNQAQQVRHAGVLLRPEPLWELHRP